MDDIASFPWERSAAGLTCGAKQVADAAGIKRVVGPVSGVACNARYDLAKGQADALKQLQARAVSKAAMA